jgi:hypothetical protein
MSSTSTGAGAERRKAPRFAVTIAAEVADIVAHTIFGARCTDLSASGCFIATSDATEIGSQIAVRLIKGSREFASLARVAYAVGGTGMGVAFATPIASAHAEVLSEWLNEAAAMKIRAETFDSYGGD